MDAEMNPARHGCLEKSIDLLAEWDVVKLCIPRRCAPTPSPMEGGDFAPWRALLQALRELVVIKPAEIPVHA